jgi:hypothetical protein
MLELCGDLNLAQEPVAADRGRKLRMQDLNGYLTVVLPVLGKEYRGHPATACFTFNSVAVAECRRETFQQVRHKSLLRERGVESI